MPKIGRRVFRCSGCEVGETLANLIFPRLYVCKPVMYQASVGLQKAPDRTYLIGIHVYVDGYSGCRHNGADSAVPICDLRLLRALRSKACHMRSPFSLVAFEGKPMDPYGYAFRFEPSGQ